MEITFLTRMCIIRAMLKNENYKRYIQDNLMHNGRTYGTLRFNKLEIGKDNIKFVFEEIKAKGVLHIEWSNIHDYIVKYFGTHEPGKDYFNLSKELKKLKRVDFNPEDKNYFIGWSHNYKTIRKVMHMDFEIVNNVYFTESSIDALIREIDNKNITREQFLTAYNEVFGGLQ